MKTGLAFDFRMVAHDCYQHPHPELPSRLHKLIDFLMSDPSLKQSKNLEILEHGEFCSDDDILLVHSKSYLSMLKSLNLKEIDPPLYWYLDTYFMDQTLDSAYLAVGVLLKCMDKIMKKEWTNALALVRPPGHHVGFIERPNGFCVFNNVAIAANYCIKKFGMKKILIFDWDVHHGDGTQEIFYDSDQVLFVSIHRYDNANYYPANKQANSDHVGKDKGKGFNINIAWNLLPSQTARTDDYVYLFERVLSPIIKEFSPEITIISAGFDSAKGDPLGGLELTNDGYAYMTKRLLDLSNGRVLAVLEGGYNLNSLTSGVKSVLEVLRGECMDLTKLLDHIKPNDVGYNACETALKELTTYWPILQKGENDGFGLKSNAEEKKEAFMKKFIMSGGHPESFKVIGDRIHKKTKRPEAEFYEGVYGSNPIFSEDDALLMKSFIPLYFGLEDKENLIKPVIILENLLAGKEQGSIMDIKLGAKGFLDNQKREKQLYELAKSRISTSEELGFRLTGMVVKDKAGNVVFTLKSKISNFEVTKLNLRDFLKRFLLGNESEKINPDALSYYVEYMKRLEKFLEEKCRVRFAAVSLFFVLDNNQQKFDVKLIDFSYWEKCQEKDANIIDGIRSLRKIFEEFL